MAFYRIEQKGKDLDFLIGSKSAARKVAQFLKRKHGGKIKYSYKLVTRREGKDLYRNIILVRIGLN